MESEAEFLTRQATLAKARLRQSARLLADELVAPFEIGPLIARRPWWSVGGAVVGGFACGLGLRRRHKAQVSKQPGRVAEFTTIATRRVGRLVSSALGAIVVAGLRGAAPAASPPPPPVDPVETP
jgi:hypothetical protein